MPPYEVRVRVRYDGKVLIPEEPLDVPQGQSLVARLEVVKGPVDERSVEERRSALLRVAGSLPAGPVPPSISFARDELMYPDRV